jgi:hypothetical protein
MEPFLVVEILPTLSYCLKYDHECEINMIYMSLKIFHTDRCLFHLGLILGAHPTLQSMCQSIDLGVFRILSAKSAILVLILKIKSAIMLVVYAILSE